MQCMQYTERKSGHVNVYMISSIEDVCERKVGVGYGHVYRGFAHWLGVKVS